MIILKPLRAQECVNIVWEFSKENYSKNYKVGNIINLGFKKESILFLINRWTIGEELPAG